MTQAAILAASGSPGTTTGFKNRLINGNMTIDQRNAGASLSFPSSSSGFPVDRLYSENYTNGAMTGQQVSDAPSPFSYSTKFTVTTASGALGATQDAYCGQKIEGFNTADLQWGTANAATVTLSFWVKSSLTGTFGGTFSNNAFNYSYPFIYTINAANTWEQKTVTVPGPTSGTWIGSTNSIGLRVVFSLASGSSYTGTPNAWVNTLYLQGTGSTNVLATNGATWQVTGTQLEVGTTATNFDFRSYGTELALCQRYYEKIGGENSYDFYMDAYNNAGTVITCPLYWKVNKRTNPSVGVVGTPGYGNCNSIAVAGSGAGTNNTTVQASVVSTGRAYCYFPSGTYFAISAEL